MPVVTEPKPPPVRELLPSLWAWFGRLLVRTLTPVVEEAIVAAMRRGAGPLIALSPEEYEAYRETLEVLADEGAMEDLRVSAEDERAGRLYDYDEVRAELGLGEAHPHAAG